MMKYSVKMLAVLALGAALLLTGCGAEEPPASAPASEPASSQPAEPASSVPAEEPASDAVPADGGLSALRTEMEPSGAVAGVMYLGYFEGIEPFSPEFYAELEASGYLAAYPFLKDIPKDCLARNDGDEIYCIVPFDPKARVEVAAWDEDIQTGLYNLYMGEMEDGSGDGVPFFVQGNVSDIMSNVSVNITDNYANELIHYHPSISLKDGTVMLAAEDQPLLLDYTIYNLKG